MTTFRIIGLDPGGTTGIATYTATRIHDPIKEMDEYYDEVWWYSQLDDNRHHLELYTFLEIQEVEETVIVCESFEYRQRQRDNLELVSKEYIGVVELFTQSHQDVKLKYQTASKGKITATSFVRKRNIERFGLWNWRYGHAMDAIGHILYYLVHEVRVPHIIEQGWK